MVEEAAAITPYDYTARQAEVSRLFDRYRRCLLDQRYYARRLSLYQRVDTGTNLFAGAAMLITLATRHSAPLVSNASYAVGALAALIFIGKPIFRVSEQIERYTILSSGFGELFSGFEALLADVRKNDGMTDAHRERADELMSRYDNLAIREDAAINWGMVEKIQEAIEKAIPAKSQWLPSK
jgi:hypothetical protein